MTSAVDLLPMPTVPALLTCALWCGALLVPHAVAQREAERPAPKASGGVLAPEQACYDVRHYDLSLRIDPGGEHIDGTLVMTADVVRSTVLVRLDLDGHLAAHGVRVHDEPADFLHEDGEILVRLPRRYEPGESLVLAVDYGGSPRVAPRPPWDGGFTWAATADDRPWIATSCQGEGADLWWPCKDHPSDKPEAIDLRIDVPVGLVVAANGRLLSETTAGGRTTFHWHLSQPVSNYAVALNIAPYVVIESEFTSVAGETFPFVFWALPESEDAARAILPQFQDHIAFLEDVCGPYPFRADKYGIAETPHLGMEHQTIIAYGNRFRPGTWPDYDWLHHHEASHEWWGNLVTCADWKDMWIHEGIGTYMQALYLERRHGPDAYRREMASQRRFTNGKAVAPRESMDSKQIYFQPNGAFDNDIYSKGSWIVHTLRYLLGDETFFAVLRRWAYPDPALERTTDGRAVRLTDTDALLAIAEDVSGRPLGWFFDVYLRQPKLPILRVQQDGADLLLRWEVPGELPFAMPVPVRIDDETLRLEMADGTGRIPDAAGREVSIDPDARVLMDVAR